MTEKMYCPKIDNFDYSIFRDRNCLSRFSHIPHYIRLFMFTTDKQPLRTLTIGICYF